LVKKGWVDPARVGCMGWSQGGYISAFLTTSSRAFKAISVGAGISNWATYYYNTDITPFTINYLGDDPADDPEIYAKTSPMTYIKKAGTPTLIQHGEFDRRVPIPNAYELRQGLEDRGVPVEMVVYKGYGHGITKPKSMRAVMEARAEEGRRGQEIAGGPAAGERKGTDHEMQRVRAGFPVALPFQDGRRLPGVLRGHGRGGAGESGDGYRVVKSLGVVRGITVRSRSVFGTIGASLQTIVGGNITLFSELCEQTRGEAFEMMVNHAVERGANAVIGVRYDATEIMQGATEVLCYGTAVIVEPA
ncbi:MAG: prolyl oligopeptidase family serine peptidase, partial [Acidobacteria bacterium]|nr:prolyl oligopeptidase family serine peptidase [Acidobacteriota bacterium]